MVERSGLFKAGEILLLVGAILQIVMGAFMLVFFTVFTAVFSDVPETDAFPFSFMKWMYAGMGLLSIAGAVVGFMAHAKARRGDATGAFVPGLVASLLPPVNVITLLGAIFCKICPEGEGKTAQPWPQQPWAPPR